MYKVFFNDRTLFFTRSPVNELVLNADAIYKYDTQKQLQRFINNFLNKEHLRSAVIYSHDIEKTFAEFKKRFTNIKAAGGVVFNDSNEFIGIFRNGKNDLPKGRLKRGETAEEGAVREVKEECGIDTVEITEPLTETYHIYFTDPCPVLKQTFWFRMYTDSSTLIPQTEKGITDIIRISQDGLKKFISNTYPSIREVINAAGSIKE